MCHIIPIPKSICFPLVCIDKRLAWYIGSPINCQRLTILSKVLILTELSLSKWHHVASRYAPHEWLDTLGSVNTYITDLTYHSLPRWRNIYLVHIIPLHWCPLFQYKLYFFMPHFFLRENQYNNPYSLERYVHLILARDKRDPIIMEGFGMDIFPLKGGRE